MIHEQRVLIENVTEQVYPGDRVQLATTRVVKTQPGVGALVNFPGYWPRCWIREEDLECDGELVWATVVTIDARQATVQLRSKTDMYWITVRPGALAAVEIPLQDDEPAAGTWLLRNGPEPDALCRITEPDPADSRRRHPRNWYHVGQGGFITWPQAARIAAQWPSYETITPVEKVA